MGRLCLHKCHGRPKDSVRDILLRCKSAGVKTVAGGPLFTSEYELFDTVDHLVLNEGRAHNARIHQRPGARQTKAYLYLVRMGGYERDACPGVGTH